MTENEQSYHFRAALHGFNREDVVNYIGASSEKYERELKQLQNLNQSLKEELADARAELEAAKAEVEDAAQFKNAANELEAVRNRLLEAETEKQNLMDRIAELEERLGAADDSQLLRPAAELPAQPDLAEPILPVSTVVPQEIAQVKDYTELELAAYRRAELAERMAKERADDVYRRIDSVFSQASGKIDSGKDDLDQLTQKIREDVNQMLLLLNYINNSYDDARASFNAVNDRNLPL